MLVDKRQRYFRRYTLRWKGRAASAAPLPLITANGPNSVVEALRKSERDGKATATDGKSTIDLIKIVSDTEKGIIVLLFHRTNPNASDPAYRRKSEGGIAVRQTAKQTGEDQVVSCHLVINTTLTDDGGYAAALEEIEGLSATTVFGIIRYVLTNFQYQFTHKKRTSETTTAFTAEGVKSESLDQALKNKASLNYLVLTRTAPSDVPDSAGIIEPRTDRARYKIIGDPTSDVWKEKFNSFVNGTKATWDQVAVEIRLEDDRQRTVVIDRDAVSAELLFVRSELVDFADDLTPCATEIETRVVDAAIKLLKKK